MAELDVQALRAIVDSQPDPDGECVKCGNSMHTTDGLDPTALCNSCAQEIVLDHVPELLDSTEALSRIRALFEDPDQFVDLLRKLHNVAEERARGVNDVYHDTGIHLGRVLHEAVNAALGATGPPRGAGDVVTVELTRAQTTKLVEAFCGWAQNTGLLALTCAVEVAEARELAWAAGVQLAAERDVHALSWAAADTWKVRVDPFSVTTPVPPGECWNLATTP